MAFATRATKITRKTVDVDINGETFRLLEMNGLERDRYEIAVVKRVTVGGTSDTEVERLLLRSRLVVQCWVDEAGARIYQDGEIEAFAVEYPASMINTLFEAAQILNGMEAKAVGGAAKNSASAPTGASSSDSH